MYVGWQVGISVITVTFLVGATEFVGTEVGIVGVPDGWEVGWEGATVVGTGVGMKVVG